ncbi:DUF6183 family protein [Streptosporangium carneum]|uniref:Uncharacterized protein n=1 Tax=Streptosporangium carneum TaxID=47481 RepID=A0A9W6MEI1_9ACTN|nr:DUF6183 family protein [Streptosporangium carneum]GLK11005.1 hypothetical protein GCM10017600_44110 [Streptosporangium carneum]
MIMTPEAFAVSDEFRRGLRTLALSRDPRDVRPLAALVSAYYAADRHPYKIRDLAALLAVRERPFDSRNPLYDEWEPVLDKLMLEEWEPVLGLLPLFERVPAKPGVWAELIACLTQELVLLGADLTRVPAALRCAAALRKQGHPLARLPLRLSRGEGNRLNRHSCSVRGWEPHHSHYYLREETEIEKKTTFPLPGWDARSSRGGFGHGEPRRVSTPGQERLIAAAVEHWGPPYLAMTIELPRRFEPGEMRSPAVNALLPGWCGREIRLKGHPATLKEAFAELFYNACCDVRHVRGFRGGYARMKAWQSVAGLVRAPAQASAHRIGRIATRWRWTMFTLVEQRQDYSRDGMISIGALSPGGDKVSLLISLSKWAHWNR